MQQMNDSDFFEYYCNCAKVTLNSGEKEAFFIKNDSYRMTYISPGYMETFPHRNLDMLNGASISEEYYNQYLLESESARKQDELVHKSSTAKNFIFIDSQQQHICHIHKRPIVNPATANFVGIIGYVSKYMHPNLLKLIYKINNINFGLTNKTAKNPLKYQLTQKQNMVLFLYLNKYSNAEISDILTILGHKISRTRVNDHLESLKFIFHVKTKEQLIEKAISHNYHLLIPRSLLRQGSYEIEEEIIISG